MKRTPSQAVPSVSVHACVVAPGHTVHCRLPEDSTVQPKDIPRDCGDSTELHSTLSSQKESLKALVMSWWVFSTLVKGYILKFTTAPPHYNALITSREQGGVSLGVTGGHIWLVKEKKAIQIVSVGGRIICPWFESILIGWPWQKGSRSSVVAHGLARSLSRRSGSFSKVL